MSLVLRYTYFLTVLSLFLQGVTAHSDHAGERSAVSAAMDESVLSVFVIGFTLLIALTSLYFIHSILKEVVWNG